MYSNRDLLRLLGKVFEGRRVALPSYGMDYVLKIHVPDKEPTNMVAIAWSAESRWYSSRWRSLRTIRCIPKWFFLGLPEHHWYWYGYLSDG